MKNFVSAISSVDPWLNEKTSLRFCLSILFLSLQVPIDSDSQSAQHSDTLKSCFSPDGDRFSMAVCGSCVGVFHPRISQQLEADYRMNFNYFPITASIFAIFRHPRTNYELLFFDDGKMLAECFGPAIADS